MTPGIGYIAVPVFIEDGTSHTLKPVIKQIPYDKSQISEEGALKRIRPMVVAKETPGSDLYRRNEI